MSHVLLLTHGFWDSFRSSSVLRLFLLSVKEDEYFYDALQECCEPRGCVVPSSYCFTRGRHSTPSAALAVLFTLFVHIFNNRASWLGTKSFFFSCLTQIH